MTHQPGSQPKLATLLVAAGVACMLAAGSAWAAGNKLLKVDCYAKPNEPECKSQPATPAPGNAAGTPVPAPLAGGRLKGSSDLPPPAPNMSADKPVDTQGPAGSGEKIRRDK